LGDGDDVALFRAEGGGTFDFILQLVSHTS